MKRSVEIQTPVRRIVSLVPSQTEFLYHLGLEEELVGLTKFCVHPNHWWKTKQRVGGTKNVDLEKVKRLKPDLIIGNKEENDQQNIESLADLSPIWMSDIKTLEDAYEMMLEIGRITGKEAKAVEIVGQIKFGFDNFLGLKTEKNVLYFIWKNPWMLAGRETFISHLLEKCNLKNLALSDRYPVLDNEINSDCGLIFLSSEPYPFKEQDIAELQIKFPKAKIKLVDGEMFSWYGSRLIHAPQYFHELLTSIE